MRGEKVQAPRIQAPENFQTSNTVAAKLLECASPLALSSSDGHREETDEHSNHSEKLEPLQGWLASLAEPGVASRFAGQPWAGGRNPFGIDLEGSFSFPRGLRRRLGFLDRDFIKELVEFLLSEAFGGIGALAFASGQASQLSWRCDDIRSQENKQFGPGAIFDFVLEEIAEDGDVSQKWNLAFTVALGVFQQAADNHRLRIRGDHDGIGGTGIDDRRGDTRAAGNPQRAVGQLVGFRRKDNLDHA